MLKKERQVEAVLSSEVDILVRGTLVPYFPGTMYRPNGDPGDPPEGGYCEDVSVCLVQEVSLRDANGAVEFDEDGRVKKKTAELDITEFLDPDLVDKLADQLYKEVCED